MALRAGGSWPATKHDWASGAIKLRDRNHDRALNGQQAPVGAAPLVKRLKLHGVSGNIRHVKLGQNLFGCFCVVVSRAAHQRKAGQRNDGIHCRLPVLHEKLVNGWARVKTRSEGRNNPKSPRFQRRYHAIVMPGVIRQKIGAQKQNPDNALYRHFTRQGKIDNVV